MPQTNAAQKLAWLRANPSLWQHLPREWSEVEYSSFELWRLWIELVEAGLYGPFTYRPDTARTIWRLVQQVRVETGL
jgi:hypothetical protein